MQQGTCTGNPGSVRSETGALKTRKVRMWGGNCKEQYKKCLHNMQKYCIVMQGAREEVQKDGRTALPGRVVPRRMHLQYLRKARMIKHGKSEVYGNVKLGTSVWYHQH